MNALYQIERELKIAGFDIVKSSLDGNAYTVYFNQLTNNEQTDLFQIIQNFVETPDIRGKKVYTVLPHHIEITNTNYTHICGWNYPGYFNEIIESVQINTSLAPSIMNDTYDLRIYDFTNNRIIAEMTFSNILEKTCYIPVNQDLLPTKMSVFEIHGKVNENSELRINTASIIYIPQ